MNAKRLQCLRFKPEADNKYLIGGNAGNSSQTDITSISPTKRSLVCGSVFLLQKCVPIGIEMVSGEKRRACARRVGSLDIPLRVRAISTYNRARIYTEAGIVTARAKTGPLILVVDDDEAVLEALGDLLVVSGYEVARAANGAAALSYLRNNPLPSLVVHDLVMPVMDGWRLQKEMKADSAMARLPIVVVSALSEPDGIEADSILIKPFDIAQFLAIVSRLTTRSATSNHSTT
ncbi:MAG: response regulator [Candidatus Binataceae bacterium]